MAKPVDKTFDVYVASGCQINFISSYAVKSWVQGVDFENINGDVLQRLIVRTQMG